jgi:hypothetical protein
MAEQLCPVCGCAIVEGESYEKEGTLYCCESCASGGPCECGCGAVTEEEEE